MSDTVKVAPRRFGGSSATPCGGCDRPVYHAEQVMGPAGRTYHRACLRCSSCGRTLDAVRLLEHEGDPYCKPCHTSSFGIEGYVRGVSSSVCEGAHYAPSLRARMIADVTKGFGGASTKSNYTDRWSPSPRSSPRSSPDKPVASSMLPSRSAASSPLKPPADPADDDEWAVKPATVAQPSFVPRGPRPMGVPAASALSGPRAPSPATSDGTNVSSGARSSGARSSGAAASTASSDRPDRCPRCQTVVYFAERVLAAGRVWHKRCCRCTGCNKALDSHLVVSGNDPYCRKCHSSVGGLAEAGIMTVRCDKRAQLTMLQRPGLF